ncbi:ribonuclease H-like domain-containing protein [Mycena olivaceomarginata]|nr:ribonuclease H-like domain-containing protein [Mycena olivaceomarginata]
MDIDFTYCDKEIDILEATKSLQACPIVFLDCEGEDMGVQSGHLWLISLGTASPGSQRIYLFDVLAIGTEGLKPIFDILASNRIQKVVFDGRMDQSALYHEYGVTMQNVLDLQLADVKSRPRRGEKRGSKEQLDRLLRYIPRSEIDANRALYQKVQRLVGLGEAVREHKVRVNEVALATKASGRNIEWTNPPSRELLIYAANDIRLITSLWSHLAQSGYLDKRLTVESLRYVTMWNGRQPVQGEIGKRHGLLPLNILDPVSDRNTLRCTGCERDLPEHYFLKWEQKKPNKRKCGVCRAIGIHIKIQTKIQRKKEAKQL